jgi:hypothetical protein
MSYQGSHTQPVECSIAQRRQTHLYLYSARWELSTALRMVPPRSRVTGRESLEGVERLEVDELPREPRTASSLCMERR